MHECTRVTYQNLTLLNVSNYYINYNCWLTYRISTIIKLWKMGKIEANEVIYLWFISDSKILYT